MQLPAMEMVISIAALFGFLWLVGRLSSKSESSAEVPEEMVVSMESMLQKILATLREEQDTVSVTKETKQPPGFPALTVTPYSLTSQNLQIYYWENRDPSENPYAIHLIRLDGWLRPSPITVVMEQEKLSFKFRAAGKVLDPSRLARKEEYYIRQIILLVEQLIRKHATPTVASA